MRGMEKQSFSLRRRIQEILIASKIEKGWLSMLDMGYRKEIFNKGGEGEKISFGFITFSVFWIRICRREV